MTENEKEIEEKLYTQKELEEILSHRLARERKNTESLQYIRDALSDFRKEEPYKSLSNAKLAEIVIDMAKKNVACNEVACDKVACDEVARNAYETAEENDTATFVPEETEPSCSAEYNGEQPENAQIAEPSFDCDDKRAPLCATHSLSEQNDDGQKEKMSEISEFLIRFGEKSLNEAINDKAFSAFCSGKRGSLCQLYESYNAFLAALSQSPQVKKYRELKNGFASTGFSGNSSPVIDYGSLLTENQRQIASASGMSYRQYAELLAQIPTKKLNYKN